KKELLLAFEKSRKRDTITRHDLNLLDPSSARDLCRVNHFAKIRWSKTFCKEVEAFFDLDDDIKFPDQPLFFVTLTDSHARQLTMQSRFTSQSSRENFRPG